VLRVAVTRAEGRCRVAAGVALALLLLAIPDVGAAQCRGLERLSKGHSLLPMRDCGSVELRLRGGVLIERYPGDSLGGMGGGELRYRALRSVSVSLEAPSWRRLGGEGRLLGSEDPWGVARALVGLDLRELGFEVGGGWFAGDTGGRRTAGAEIVFRLRVGSRDAIALVVEFGQPVWAAEDDGPAPRDIPRTIRAALPMVVPVKRAPAWAVEAEVAAVRGPLCLFEAQLRLGLRRRWPRMDLAVSLLSRRAVESLWEDDATAFSTLGMEVGVRLRPPRPTPDGQLRLRP
tara:strand:+ start:898 stop:1764 length:867 start_codon:yes stop_codon:yes gene_type:complete